MSEQINSLEDLSIARRKISETLHDLLCRWCGRDHRNPFAGEREQPAEPRGALATAHDDEIRSVDLECASGELFVLHREDAEAACRRERCEGIGDVGMQKQKQVEPFVYLALARGSPKGSDFRLHACRA